MVQRVRPLDPRATAVTSVTRSALFRNHPGLFDNHDDADGTGHAADGPVANRVAAGVLLAALVAGCGQEEWLEVSDGEAEDVGKADGADDTPRVELKLTLSDGGERVRDRLHLAKSAGEKRSITFYDTTDLDLFEAGIVLRTRQIDGKPDDSTVKLRPLDPTLVDEEWFEENDFKCETDRTLARSVDSCSLSDRRDSADIDAVADGEDSIDSLFDSDQERFLEDYGSIGVDFDTLYVLGPAAARVWKIETDALPADVTVEIWRLPSREIIELSMKVEPDEADDAMKDLLAWVGRRRLHVASQADTKTRATLEEFAALAR